MPGNNKLDWAAVPSLWGHNETNNRSFPGSEVNFTTLETRLQSITQLAWAGPLWSLPGGQGDRIDGNSTMLFDDLTNEPEMELTQADHEGRRDAILFRKPSVYLFRRSRMTVEGVRVIVVILTSRREAFENAFI